LLHLDLFLVSLCLAGIGLLGSLNVFEDLNERVDHEVLVVFGASVDGHSTGEDHQGKVKMVADEKEVAEADLRDKDE